MSVIVPFRGDRRRAKATLHALGRLELREGDELILADNSDDGAATRIAGNSDGDGVGAPAGDSAHVVHATRERSSYHARNVGAAAAGNEWLLFMDADCVPDPHLLDAYFAEPVAGRCGALAGQIIGAPEQRSLAARYARSRRMFDHAEGLIRAEDGGAGAGNLLVRRAAFDEIGGFVEGIRSGGDLDLCRRLRLAGWGLEFRPGALVHHRHRETLPSLLGAVARYGAGARWLNERYPGSSPRWPLIEGLRQAAGDVARLAVAGRFDAAIFRAVDALGLIAHNVGHRAGNGVRAG